MADATDLNLVIIKDKFKVEGKKAAEQKACMDKCNLTEWDA